MPLQNKVTHDTKVTQEERTVPVFRHSNEDSVIDEAKVTQEERTVPVFRHSNEDSVVEETDVIGDLPILNTVTPEAKNTSEDGVAPCFDSADEESIVEETGGIEHMTEQNMVIPEADIVSEDVVAPCFDSSNECMMVEEIIADTEELTVSLPDHEHVKAVEDVTEQNTAIPEASIISEDDIAPYFDSSNEGLMVGEMLVDTTEEAGVSSPNQAHQKVAAESATFCFHEHTTVDEEELENVARVEAESASVVGPGVELPTRDDVSEDSVSETIKESRSTPWSCEHEKQEVGAATFSDREPRTQAREELNNVATVESDFIGGFELADTRGSENDQVNIDSAREEEVANELESTPLYPDHVDHELKTGSRFCEPLPNFIQTEETTNFEHHVESLIQSLERHERKKWEIPKEAFELPEVLKSGISEVHDTLEQDSCELKRQTDKHGRKKWEIPRETFKLPVLDDEVVGVIEEKEDQESVTLSAEKPERKKWKIQKEVFEVPTLFAEAVQETSEQEGFVIKTAFEEEMRIRDDRFSKILFSEESDQHGEAQKEFSADEEVVVPDEGVFPGVCDDNSPDHVEKEWMPEIKMLGEEERVNQFNETCDPQETKVEEGAAAGQEECTKGQEDINVKDELKRTLGMLWKKICKSQQDEDLETGDSMTEENYTFKDEKGRGGVDKGLNLKGPVELVESPRQQDDIEVLNFSDQSSGDEENRKETSSSSQFEANGSKPFNSGVFISTTEVTEDSSSESAPCKLQEDDSRSCAEETCKQYYTANDVESHSEEIQSSLGSVGSAETTQIHGHGADKSLKKGSPEKKSPPSDVNECGWIDCEAADNINTSLVTRKAKTDDDKPSGMEATGSMRKEVTPDQEVLNNIMRAKEIERIVVERTIREVRERAFAEARERAARDRASAEAQQKALADDQERSQETSSEAKLAAEKNSLEGKRKSELERAAVERATAEARQRALEKAMSRQVSHGSSSKSANAADPGSSSKDRLTNDKPSESAMRFKSRNERHQRVAERAAKALEEKNMRDLLVQREQAERSRLSEVLDADVKRWASGKTSNLRALLSTLQYILGPDSGWKPIHLTDILTADAVKKAYRKATLFVHPDKLQQRGASIKQKYICEQVFDLLKEAWNKFDRDER
uniref:J domain-containing protein n=1 Tax=Kalanchoe fedtschenkoi TaxID=63787 RepID=A0A7N1A6L2_KALFE